MPLRPARPTRPGGEKENEDPLVITDSKSGPTQSEQPLTDSVQEEFGLGRKVVVDDVVQQGDIDTACGHVGHNQHHGPPVHKLANVDLPCCVVEGAVDVGALYAFRGEQLEGRNRFLSFYRFEPARDNSHN